MYREPPPPDVSLRFSRLPRRDTQIELEIRRRLHARGLRYRVDAKPLPATRRKADLVFPTAKVAVFIDGCFWHGCPVHATWPKQNAEFWREKIKANRLRDADTNLRLSDMGWTVLRFWEHEPPIEAVETIAQTVVMAKAGRRASTDEHKKN